MKQLYFPLVIILVIAIASGCSGQSSGPVLTDPVPGMSAQNSAGSTTHIWGYWDCMIDVETREVIAVPNRSLVFAANVTRFINNDPQNLSFKINDIIPGNGTDIDIDVTIKHPFPGMSQYNGYDVRGIFVCDGSGGFDYNDKILYPVHVEGEPFGDQTMPFGYAGSADGYTRWYNPEEFPTAGLFGYVPGIFAKPGYQPSATLCPYKYFSDSLGTTENLWEFLNETDNNGVFSAGATNTRNYYLRWPDMMEGLPFAYTIIANWEGVDVHPSNATEAVGCLADVTPNLYYVDDTVNGGHLIADVRVFDWLSDYEGYGPMEDYTLIIESTVTGGAYILNATEMVPTGGDDNYSTYHVDIVADSVESNINNEFWVMVEYSDYDYSNDFGVPNSAGTDPLTGYFRFPLEVSSEPVSGVICDVVVHPDSPPMPYEGIPTAFTFDASGSYDLGGADLTYEWDFDNDGEFGDSYDGGTDDIPVKVFTEDNLVQVCVRVSNGAETEECCVPVDITIEFIDKNIELRDGFDAMDIAIDHADGDLLVLYSDGIVYRYTEDGDYQDGAQFIMTFEPGIQYIDIAPNSYIVVGGYWVNEIDKMLFYEPDGSLLSNAYIGNECYAHDVIAFTGHTYTNMLGISSFTCPMGTYFRWRWYQPPDYSVYWYANLYGGCGLTTIGRDSAVAVEAGNISMNYVYVLEGAGGACYEYSVQRVYRPTGTTIENDPSVTWGGVQSDGMDGFWDPKDITRDIDNDFYILDSLSTNVPLIKKYTENGTAVGSFGDSVNISGAPLRIEGSDYEGSDGNLMFVIHDGGSGNPDLLSIFYPSEIPD